MTKKQQEEDKGKRPQSAPGLNDSKRNKKKGKVKWSPQTTRRPSSVRDYLSLSPLSSRISHTYTYTQQQQQQQ